MKSVLCINVNENVLIRMFFRSEPGRCILNYYIFPLSFFFICAATFVAH